MADWESQSGTYRTMGERLALGNGTGSDGKDHEFEIRELRIFQDMVKKGRCPSVSCRYRLTFTGLISYHLRPTFYSPALRSALAESELSYEDDHESRSVYIGYPVAAEDMSKNLRQAWEQAGSPSLKLPIWTTTPWSLPGNLVRRSDRLLQSAERCRVLLSAQTPNIASSTQIASEHSCWLRNALPLTGKANLRSFSVGSTCCRG